MNKKALSIPGIVGALILMLIVVLVLFAFIPWLKQLLGIGVSYASDDYGQKNPQQEGGNAKSTSNSDNIALDDFNNFLFFFNNLQRQQFITQCKVTFSFSDNFPVNYFVLVTSNGDIELRGGDKGANNVIKKDRIIFVPYASINDDFSLQQYFQMYYQNKNPYVITASGGFVVTDSPEKPLLVQTKTIVAVNKEKKWIMSRINPYLENNNKFPDCFGIATQ